MYAIISELDPNAATTVSGLWQQLCLACGLTEIYHLPTPHFTWFLADHLDSDIVIPLVKRLTTNLNSFQVHTFGLGIFTGEKPVLYLPIVKSAEMIRLHREIWNQIQPYGDEVQQYYSPRLWVPHITLALKDLTEENLACAVNSIAFEPIELFIKVGHIALVAYENENANETLLTWSLSSEKE